MLNISGQNIQITTSIKSVIETRYQKLSQRFMINNGEFHFNQEHGEFRCHVTVNTQHFGQLSAESSESDFYKSATSTFTKLERQLSDAKEKLKEKGRDKIIDHLVEE